MPTTSDELQYTEITRIAGQDEAIAMDVVARGDSKKAAIVDGAFNRSGSGSISALNGTVTANTQGFGSVIFNVTGTWVGTMQVRGSNDSFVTQNVLLTATDGSQAIFASSTSNTVWYVNCAGYAEVRIIMSAYTSGTANVLWGAGVGNLFIQAWNTNATSLKVAPRSDILSATGSAGSLNADLIASTDLGGYQCVELQVTGTWVGTLTVQGSDDNSTFVSVFCGDTSNLKSIPSSTITANGMYYIPLVFRYLRVRMTSYTSGTANSTYVAETIIPPDFVARHVLLSDGTNTIGTSSNPVPVSISSISSYSSNVTYSATVTGLVPAALATDFFTITGSASKTIYIKRIVISFASVASTNTNVVLIKRSSANSGGTSTTRTAVPYDSNDAAATATVRAYTANPTLGTSVGEIYSYKGFSTGGSSVLPQITSIDFGLNSSKPIILRGTSQVLALNLAGVTISSSTCNVTIEWIEV